MHTKYWTWFSTLREDRTQIISQQNNCNTRNELVIAPIELYPSTFHLTYMYQLLVTLGKQTPIYLLLLLPFFLLTRFNLLQLLLNRLITRDKLARLN